MIWISVLFLVAVVMFIGVNKGIIDVTGYLGKDYVSAYAVNVRGVVKENFEESVIGKVFDKGSEKLVDKTSDEFADKDFVQEDLITGYFIANDKDYNVDEGTSVRRSFSGKILGSKKFPFIEDFGKEFILRTKDGLKCSFDWDNPVKLKVSSNKIDFRKGRLSNVDCNWEIGHLGGDIYQIGRYFLDIDPEFYTNDTLYTSYPEGVNISHIESGGMCSPILDSNWTITDNQTCDGIIADVGTGMIIIEPGGTLTLISYANVSASGLEMNTVGDAVFIEKGSILVLN